MSSEDPVPVHRMLARQIRKATNAHDKIDIQLLCKLVSRAYNDFDNTIQRHNRAIDLVSKEMAEKNSDLKLHKDNLESLVKNLTEELVREKES